MIGRSNRWPFVLAVGLGLSLAILWFALIGLPPAALAEGGSEILRVATTGSDGPGCGGAANPCRSLQYAVGLAQPGAEILVAAGVYTGVQNIPSLSSGTFVATQVVAIDKELTLRGGYRPADWTVSDPLVHPTILDAQGLGRVMVIVGDISVTVENLSLTGGNATALGGVSWGAAGGGVYVSGATVRILYCDIYSNTAYSRTNVWVNGYGAGLYLYDSPGSSLLGNRVRSNVGTMRGHGYGGGLYARYCDSATLRGNRFEDNWGTMDANGDGGGLCIADSDRLVLDGNDITGNTGSPGANYNGGGMAISGCDDLTVSGNRISKNLAGAAWSYGGGMYLVWSWDADIRNNLFEGNTASTWDGWGGGAYIRDATNLRFSGNVLRYNDGNSNPSQSSWGGGLYLEGRWPVTLTNNAIYDNRATTAGAGLLIAHCAPLLLHNTFAANSGGDGSAVCITGTASIVTMTNSIVAGQSTGVFAGGGSRAQLDHTLWHDNGADISGDVAQSHPHSGDPAFAADGYHLTVSSAARDLGANVGVATDIDGQARPGGAGVDLGADEFWLRIVLPVMLR
jgi:nitrous oxidase accessory protein NosD